jgi:hypothetical protein
VTALEGKYWGELETSKQQAREIRERLGLAGDAGHADVLDAIDVGSSTRALTMLAHQLKAEVKAVLAENADLRRQLAEALALNDSFRAELDALTSEQPRDPAQVSIFDESDPTQQRRRLALVATEDPPLDRAADAIVDAVMMVPGVDSVAVDSLPEQAGVFMVWVSGGDDEEIAAAILRTFPQRTVATSGTTRVEVDGEVVWICRPKPHA